MLKLYNKNPIFYTFTGFYDKFDHYIDFRKQNQEGWFQKRTQNDKKNTP